jgi:hypothetical protein
MISVSIVLVFIFFAPLIFSKLFSEKSTIRFLLIINVASLFLLSLYSFFIQDNSFTLVIRFFVILVLILTAFFLPRKNFFVQSFIAITVIHSLFLLIFEIYIVFFSDPHYPTHIRNTVLAMGVGDIYSYNGFYYRIQIKGNSLLPIAFLISLFSIQKKTLKVVISSLLFIGTFIAGNFAFIIAVVFFFMVHLLIILRRVVLVKKEIIKGFLFKSRARTSITLLLVVTLLALIIIPTLSYVKDVLERKSDYSIPTRFDQVVVLMDDLAESPMTLLFGQGLGNTVNVKTEYRDYTNDIYFELQSLYILNQVGILYMILFLITHFIFAVYFWRNWKVYLLYLSYLLYGITNPYIFDTTNIIIIIVLTSLSKQLNDINNKGYYLNSINN